MTPEPLILGLMLAMTAIIVFARSLLVSLLGLSLFSMFLTLQYVYMHAPDVAMTEAALGAGLSTLVFLVAIRKTRGGAHD